MRHHRTAPNLQPDEPREEVVSPKMESRPVEGGCPMHEALVHTP